MPGQAAWKGHLRLSLVVVPVRAYTATRSGQNPISLNQLHRTCHSRIRYKKTCPEHGEITSGEIVMGYEYAKGEYVVIDPEELDRLRTEADRSINVSEFVPIGSVDPTYFAGRAYYLLPDGRVGEKPYALLRQTMAEENVCGLAQVVITSREHLVMVRAVDELLVMNLLEYAAEVRSPREFIEEAPEASGKREELRLTRMLVKALEKPGPHLEQYHDLYYERLRELIDAKVAGRDVVAPRDETPVRSVNFMEALKASVVQVKTPARSAKRSAASRSSGHADVLKKAKQSVNRKRRKSG